MPKDDEILDPLAGHEVLLGKLKQAVENLTDIPQLKGYLKLVDQQMQRMASDTHPILLEYTDIYFTLRLKISNAIKADKTLRVSNISLHEKNQPKSQAHSSPALSRRPR